MTSGTTAINEFVTLLNEIADSYPDALLKKQSNVCITLNDTQQEEPVSIDFSQGIAAARAQFEAVKPRKIKPLEAVPTAHILPRDPVQSFSSFALPPSARKPAAKLADADITGQREIGADITDWL